MVLLSRNFVIFYCLTCLAVFYFAVTTKPQNERSSNTNKTPPHLSGQTEQQPAPARAQQQQQQRDNVDRWRCNGAPVPENERKRFAVTSFLVSADTNYLEGVGVLGRSLLSSTDRGSVGMYLLMLNDTPITQPQEFYLSRSGWKICRVPLIEPVQPEKVLDRFRQQFTKLVLWTWTEFERIVYLDADTLVTRDISGLFTCLPADANEDPASCDFAATLDYADGAFRKGFNMGVFALKPSLKTFTAYLELSQKDTSYDLIMAEQGMLNKVHESVPWHRLNLIHNANLAIYMQDRDLWERNAGEICVIHYTMAKPFNLVEGNEHERTWSPVAQWFKQAETTAIVITSTGLYGKVMAKAQLLALKQLWHSTPNVDIFFWTDNEGILNEFSENRDVVLFKHTKLGWPEDTYQRPSLYLEQKDVLSAYTYIFSLDADLLPRREVTSVINGDLVGLKHPGMINSSPADFTFERRPESAAYIPVGEGKTYYQGSLYGGRSELVIQLWTEVKKQISTDLEKGIIARFHEESHLNHYLWKHPPTKELGPSYSFPGGWNIKGETMIIEHLDKGAFGGHSLFQSQGEDPKPAQPSQPEKPETPEEPKEPEDPPKINFHDTWRCNGRPVSTNKKFAVVSWMASPDSTYLRAAGVLGHSILAHTNHETTGMYLMVLDTSPVSEEQEWYLAKAGWTVCKVALIKPLYPDRVFPRYRENLTKMAIWTWTEFERIVYMDADTLVVGDLSPLFTEVTMGLAATLDYSEGRITPDLNTGVMSLEPSTTLFDKYLHMINTRTDYRLDMAEQGLLNKVYLEEEERAGGKQLWQRFSFVYDANLAIYMQNRAFWEELVREGLKIIHFTMIKPFNLDQGAPERSWEPIQLWFKNEQELDALKTS